MSEVAIPAREAADAPATTEEPVPLLRGGFAIYETPGGDMVLAFRPEGAAEAQQLVVPAFVLSMAARQSGGTVEGFIDRLRDMGTEAAEDQT